MITENARPEAEAMSRPDEPGRGGRRRIAPRRRLPGGRAVVGGLLVAIAAVAAIVVASSGTGPPEVDVVVAAARIAPGDPLGPDVLRVERMALPDELLDSTYAASDDLEGTVARSAIDPGELVQRGDVIESTTAQRAAAPAREFTLHLDADRVGGGRLEAGDLVDVLATFGTGADAWSTVVLADASVLDAWSTDDAIGSVRGVTLTLVLDSRRDTVALAHAVDVAQLRIVRTTTAAPDDEPVDTYRAAPATDVDEVDR